MTCRRRRGDSDDVLAAGRWAQDADAHEVLVALDRHAEQPPLAAGVTVGVERLGLGMAEERFVAHALEQHAPPLGVGLGQNLVGRDQLRAERDALVDRYAAPAELRSEEHTSELQSQS